MAEIALGVIPLIGTAFTTYRSLHRHLRAFRHASKDLERTTKKFGVQKDRFKLECWLLLRSALEEHTITELEANEDFWNDPAVNAEFQLNFKSSYQSCYDIIEDVSQHLKEFEGELAEFAPLIKGREEGESMTDCVRRCRKRVQFTINRKKYEEICRDLKESNTDLTDLSEKIERLQRKSCTVGHRQCLLEARRQRGDGGWGAACKARRASAALYEGLQQAWSCQSSPHGHHTMRLFLDVPKPSKLSSMQLSLSVLGKSAQQGRTVPTAFHLRVDSKETQWASENEAPSPPDSHSRFEIDSGRPLKRAKMIEPLGQNSPSVANTHDHIQVSNSTSTRSQKAPYQQAAQDLACILDLCGHFGQHCLCPAQQMPQYIGYLDVPDNVRHEFYRSFGRLQTPCEENVPLSALLTANTDPREMNIPQRLKLASVVASTALTYFETPWMKDLWKLRDISLLFASTQDASTLLDTLHLEVDLMSRKHLLPPPGDPSSMDMVLTPDSANSLTEDDLLDKGIYNKSLHSLGVALVGIETSKDLDPSNWEDVRNVRRWARGSAFGDKYQAVVEKCLAYNCDLGRPKSHKQVFECVVGTLQDMVAALELNDGE